ncbi:MAG: tetratricopeptide repeat protein, partial [Gammaproteobacteria bacterium]
FNDVHALMAFIGTGEEEAGARIVDAVTRRGRDAQGVALSMMAREVGQAVSRALVAFGAAHYDDAIESLLAVRGQAHRYGGSHAQRDLLDLTLIQAAIRSGRTRLAEHLLNERIARRAVGGLGRRWLAEARAADVRGQVAA